MKKRRFCFVFLLLLTCSCIFMGCSEKSDTVTSVGALKGPTAIGMVKLMEDAANNETANPYQFTIAGTADELTGKIISGEIPIAAIPCNLASVLYQKSEGEIQVAAINTLGVLYVVETGDSVKSTVDLKGKTIYSTGKGTTPEYTLNYLLRANGIDPDKDVTIEYKSEAAEIAALLSEQEGIIAMLPQPYVTTVLMNNDKANIAFSITEEWEKIVDNESSVVTGVVVVNKDFAKENQDLVNSFLTEYSDSVTYVNENVEDASKLVEKYDIFKAALAKEAIPYCNIVFITGDEAKSKVSGYLQTLYDQDPKTVGGAMPDDDFYYGG